MPADDTELPDFHPMTVIAEFDTDTDPIPFRLSDALTGAICLGATGSGKTSGPGAKLAKAYLGEGFGGLVLCAKKDERPQWETWAKETGRYGDLVIFDKSAKYRFNFLDWEAQRPGEGGGLTINIVALLDEIAGTLSRGAGSAQGGGGGDDRFFEDALHHMNTNLVDLATLGNLPVSLPLLRRIVNAAPTMQIIPPEPIDPKTPAHEKETPTEAEIKSQEWLDSNNDCATALRAANTVTKERGDPEARADYEECRNYWLLEWPGIGDRTRSIIQLMFSMLVRPLLTRPLRKLFASDTNVQPEDMFQGKVFIIDLPVQEFRLAGRIANLLWKYCAQIAILRRKQLNQKNRYLPPVFIYADEYQNFVGKFDSEYQAVARSAGGCTVALSQTREALRNQLHSNDAVDSLLANLQAKFFCQNTGDTNEWASKSVLGERWVTAAQRSVGVTENSLEVIAARGGSVTTSLSDQLRRYVDPAIFATLKRGGPKHDFEVQCVFYNGGELFEHPDQDTRRDPSTMPYKLLTFRQKADTKKA
jgi:hypothetical protein